MKEIIKGIIISEKNIELTSSYTDNDGVLLSTELVIRNPSNRCKQFLEVVVEVVKHIENYTVPQYGDYPDDQATNFTEHDIIVALEKYYNRIGRNARGPVESRRDLLKIIHYATMLYDKSSKKMDRTKNITEERIAEAQESERLLSGDISTPEYMMNTIDHRPCKNCGGTGYDKGVKCICSED